MKKLIALLIVATIIISLASCVQNPSGSTLPSDTSANNSSSSEPNSSEPSNSETVSSEPSNSETKPPNTDPSDPSNSESNPSDTDTTIDKDYMLGLTVQPQKLDVAGAIAILDEFGFDRFFLDSDMSNNPSDHLSVPKTVRELKKLGYKQSEIEKVSQNNAKEYYKI